MTFSLPSPLSLLKLPNIINARAEHISVHFFAVLYEMNNFKNPQELMNKQHKPGLIRRALLT